MQRERGTATAITEKRSDGLLLERTASGWIELKALVIELENELLS
jgi:hypothetical protein